MRRAREGDARARVRKQKFEQSVHCKRVPWTASDIERAERSSQKRYGSPDEPSRDYQVFDGWQSAWQQYEKYQCEAEYGERWQRERWLRAWSALQRQEVERPWVAQEQQARVAVITRVAALKTAAREREAKRRGFAALADSIESFLGQVVAEGWTTERMRSVLVVQWGANNLMKVGQVLGKWALVMWRDLRILIPNPAGTVHEGTTLVVATQGLPLRVLGTRSYQSLSGAA